MKKYIYTLLILSNLSLISCDTDVVPKGKTTLETLDDVELLLNNISINSKPSETLGVICNESYGNEMETVESQIKQNTTTRYANLTYDESIDRASLASADYVYSAIYENINYMNVILSKIDGVTGDASTKAQISAEAHVMRAYMHFLAANIYAKQYDSSSASTNGGIAYVTDVALDNIKQKVTLEEAYKDMLADCTDEYIASFPDKASDVKRGSKAWANAVRASILFQMKDYTHALSYALASLQYNNTIEDRSSIVKTLEWKLPANNGNNLLFLMGSYRPVPNWEQLSLETKGLFETGDYVKDYAYVYGDKNSGSAWNNEYGEMDSGISGVVEYNGENTYVNAWGITSERMYYMAAECYIRTGEYQKGLNLVNLVREKRIDSTHYTAFTAKTEEEAMTLLQKAKFIEDIGTYQNFFDRKRWNSEDKYKKTITRTIPDIGSYSIKPDSKLWITPFPLKATQNNSTLTQNY